MGKEKKVMILAPHQDDEVILCGAFLKRLVNLKYRIYVVFMTNGDYEEHIGLVRMQEALEVMRLYGIPKNQVIFLGYANEYAPEGAHIYNAPNGQVVASQYGNKYTYGLPSHPEYCFQKNGVHHEYTRENIVDDLYSVIVELMPDIIFATDVEIHPDHKANSLFLDEVLGRCLHQYTSYRPIVLKQPEYNTSWNGKKDYSVLNNAQAVQNTKKSYVNYKQSQFANPYIRWTDRVRIPVDASARTILKEDNILYQALKLYDSQNAVSHFDSLVNSDVVFWNRRTDSLTYTAKVTASSGDAALLHDFKIIDSSDIRRKSADEWTIDAGIWRPDRMDKVPKITVELSEPTMISEIVIYQEFFPQSSIEESYLLLDGKELVPVGCLKKDRPTTIHFTRRSVKRIEYIVKKCSNPDIMPGVTEFEVYQTPKRQLSQIKIMIHDNFVYEYFVQENLQRKLQVYEIYDDARTCVETDLSKYHIFITNEQGDVLETEDYIKNGRLQGKIDGAIKIRMENHLDRNVYDEIAIFPKKVKPVLQTAFVKNKEFVEQLQKADSMLSKKDYLDFLKKLYYLCLSKQQRKECAYVKAEYLRIFKQIHQNREASEKEKQEAAYFLLMGEVQSNIAKYVRQYLGGKQNVKKVYSDKAKIYFVGTPDHGNLGDHIIAYASKQLLEDMVPNMPIAEISMKEFARALPQMKCSIRKEDMIVLQGGGNMGNTYWRNERIRREIIKNFPENKIIIFPETIFYTRDSQGDADFAISKEIYSRAANLTICAREKESFEIMSKAYTENKVIRTPDIVCYLKPNINVDRNTVKLYFRNDLEKVVTHDVQTIIEQELDLQQEKYEYKDMMYPASGYVGRANRDRIVSEKIKEIASSKLVITDRLHAMILSAITGTPCLVIAGYNHKIESTYHTWFDKIPYIKLLDDVQNIKKEIVSLLQMKQVEIKDFRNDFKELYESLEEVKTWD